MSGRQNKFLPALFLVAVTVAPVARAADPPQPPVATPEATRADTLFQEGKALLEQGSFTEACDRLAKSDTLDPTISALGLLAGCHEQQGRLATAWKEYRATAKRAETAGDSRADFAKQRAAALEPRVPKLVIRPARPSPSMEILLALDRVPSAEIGVDIPVDPGAYEIIARAPQMREFRVSITAKEGARLVVDVPELVPPSGPPYPSGAASEPGTAPSLAKAGPAPSGSPPVAPSSGGLTGRQTVALVAGGIGVVSLGVGIAFGASALSKNVQSTTIRESCSPQGTCDTGRELRESAFQAATVSTVGFSIGAAGLLTGLVVVLLPQSGGARAVQGDRAARSSVSARNVWIAPRIGGGEAGAVLLGSF